MFVILVLMGCSSPKQKPIQLNKDNCYLCKMLITDPRFGAELVTKKGKVYIFDSIECLLNNVNKKDLDDSYIYQLLVTDFNQPHSLIDVKMAIYLLSPHLKSPMGFNVAAFQSSEFPTRYVRSKGGDIFDWKKVNSYYLDQLK